MCEVVREEGGRGRRKGGGRKSGGIEVTLWERNFGEEKKSENKKERREEEMHYTHNTQNLRPSFSWGKFTKSL